MISDKRRQTRVVHLSVMSVCVRACVCMIKIKSRTAVSLYVGHQLAIKLIHMIQTHGPTNISNLQSTGVLTGATRSINQSSASLSTGSI